MTQTIKEQAVLLRQDGKTYKEISQLLHGAVSVDWCKKNLKAVVKNQTEEACIQEITILALRPEGVGIYEANGIILKYHKEKNLSSDQVRYIRNKAKTKNSNCLFRPDWISADDPQQSYKSFCAYVLHMQDELDNLVRWYCDSYEDVNPSAVKYELLEYLKPDKEGMSLKTRIDKAEQISEVISSRKETL